MPNETLDHRGPVVRKGPPFPELRFWSDPPPLSDEHIQKTPEEEKAGVVFPQGQDFYALVPSGSDVAVGRRLSLLRGMNAGKPGIVFALSPRDWGSRLSFPRNGLRGDEPGKRSAYIQGIHEVGKAWDREGQEAIAIDRVDTTVDLGEMTREKRSRGGLLILPDNETALVGLAQAVFPVMDRATVGGIDLYLTEQQTRAATEARESMAQGIKNQEAQWRKMDAEQFSGALRERVYVIANILAAFAGKGQFIPRESDTLTRLLDEWTPAFASLRT